MSSFFVFQLEFFLKSVRTFNTKISLLKRVFITQNDLQNEVDLLFLKISSLYKSSLQSLNINVFCTIRIETKRKRKIKKTNAAKRNRKFKLSIDSQLLSSFERSSKTSLEKSIEKRKTTKQMLSMKNTQQNKTQRKKKRRWYNKKREKYQRMHDETTRRNQTSSSSFFSTFFALKSSNVDLFSSFSSLFSFVFLSHVVSFLLSQSFSTISHQNWELIKQLYFF
jgi:hypothetical protein